MPYLTFKQYFSLNLITNINKIFQNGVESPESFAIQLAEHFWLRYDCVLDVCVTDVCGPDVCGPDVCGPGVSVLEVFSQTLLSQTPVYRMLVAQMFVFRMFVSQA